MVFQSVLPTNKKIVFITGCDSGVGRFLSLKMLTEGHKVIATFCEQSSYEHEDFKKYAENFIPILCDFTSSNYIPDIVSALKENTIYSIDCLINNAGVSYPDKINCVDEDRISEMFHVNIISMIVITKTILNYLKENEGRIINVSSFNGLIGFPYLSVYSSTKYAIEGFTDSLRRELRRQKIKVILIRPGYLKTKIWSRFSLSNNYSMSTESKNEANRFISFIRMISKTALNVEDVYPYFQKAIFNQSSPNVINIFRKYQYFLLYLNFFSKDKFDLVSDFFINYSLKQSSLRGRES